MAKKHRSNPGSNTDAERLGSAGSSPELDQRKSERLPVALPITYQIDGQADGKTLNGRSATTDLSGRGLQFLVPWTIAQKSRCHVTLDMPHAGARVKFLGTVSWCQPVDAAGGQFEIGVEIEPAEGDEEAYETYCHFIASQILVRSLTEDES